MCLYRKQDVCVYSHWWEIVKCARDFFSIEINVIVMRRSEENYKKGFVWEIKRKILRGNFRKRKKNQRNYVINCAAFQQWGLYNKRSEASAAARRRNWTSEGDPKVSRFFFLPFMHTPNHMSRYGAAAYTRHICAFSIHNNRTWVVLRHVVSVYAHTNTLAHTHKISGIQYERHTAWLKKCRFFGDFHRENPHKITKFPSKSLKTS